MTLGGATRNVACSESPNFANMYFDQTPYFVEGVTPTYEADYAGYYTTGYEYDVNVCVTTANQQAFCTTSDETIYGADRLGSNNWNPYSNGAAGTFGMGRSSPIWKIMGLSTPGDSLKHDVYMANFNGWTWAQADWAPVTT